MVGNSPPGIFMDGPCSQKEIERNHKTIEMAGHFTLISSPENVTGGQIRGRITRNFNEELIDDASEMSNFLKARNILPSPFAESHGIAAASNFDSMIHSKPQFLKEVSMLANLVRVPETWDVVIYYVGHGLEGEGDWVIGGGELLKFEDVMSKWADEEARGGKDILAQLGIQGITRKD